MAQAEAQANTSAVGTPGQSEALPRAPGHASPLVAALSVLLLPTLLLAACDAVGTTAALRAGRLTSSLLLLVYVLPLFLLVSALGACGFEVMRRLQVAAQGRGLPRLGGATRASAWAAALPVAAAACALVFLLSYISATAFDNHALAALLCALVALGSAVPLYGLWLAAFAGLHSLGRRLPQRQPLMGLVVWSVAALPLVLVLTGLVLRNTSGLKTLPAWLGLGPVAGGAALGPCLRLWRRWQGALGHRLRLVPWIALPLSVLGASLVSFSALELPQLAVRGQLWSGKLVVLARLLTDVDRDGSSSLFGEEDCAPLDSTIHPLARDVPGDGIDSNCVGGDASPELGQQPPPWLEAAPGRAPGLNLVVVTIEAVRADHMSFHGYGRQTTPNISALAQKSQVFEHAYAGSNATVMSMLSFWGTRTPTQVKGGRASGAPVWIPELLQQEGFRTSAALVSWKRFDTLDRGFDRFDMATPLLIDGGFRGFPDVELIDDTIAFIAKNKGGRFMTWAHLVGPHYVYERAPGAPSFGDTTPDLYDSELWAADREVGRLLEYLRREHLLERSIVIVTGDHGEALGEHGVETHHETLFDAELHTMTVMYLPGVEPRVVTQPVLHRDLLTTAMNVLGVRRGFEQLRGRNLTPLLLGQRMEEDTLFMEMASYKGEPLKVAALHWPFKLHYDVKSRRKALYDLRADPHETRDVRAAHPAELAELSQRIAKHLEAQP